MYGNLSKMIPYPSEKVHPELGRATLISTGIESFPKGDAHTIQSKCVLSLDRRLLPGDDPRAAVSDIEKSVGTISDLSVKVEMGNFLYPSEVSTGCDLVRDLNAAIEKVLGKKAEWNIRTR